MIHSKNRNKGYTLIELMVVVGIIALLLGLSLNGLNNLIQWNKLNTAAALLSSELKNIHSRAFYEGVYYKLQFWPTLDRYRIYRQTELIQDIILEDINLFVLFIIILDSFLLKLLLSLLGLLCPEPNFIKTFDLSPARNFPLEVVLSLFLSLILACFIFLPIGEFINDLDLFSFFVLFCFSSELSPEFLDELKKSDVSYDLLESIILEASFRSIISGNALGGLR